MKLSTDEYDVIVIGGGTAGSNAARSARSAGAKNILIVHLPELINTCAERGCMPSKSIISSSERGESFEDAVRLMDTHISTLTDGLHDSLKNEFEMIEGKASFLGEGKGITIEGADGSQSARGKRYVIATGSSSFVPPIQGLDTLPEGAVLTSDDVVSHKHIKELPSSIFILGGGPIGLEMMTVFSHFGSNVIVADRGSLLPRMDPEFGREMKKAIDSDKNVTWLSSAKLASVRSEGNGLVFSVECDGKTEEYRAEKLLVAVGRRPILDSLNLGNAGIISEKGRIKFDEKTLLSDNPDIYIAGDMTGTYQILHYAVAMGKVAGHNAAKGVAEREIDYTVLKMGVIFSEPQIAQVGISEREAKESGIETVSSVLELPNIGRGFLENRQVGLWKMTAEKKNGRIIGAQAVGPSPHSEWFVDLVSWMMYFKGTVRDLREKAPYYHPTYPELLQSMGRELCKKLGDDADDTICPGS